MSKKSIRSLQALAANGLVEADQATGLQQVVDNFSLAITEQMHLLIDKNNPNDPIAKQFVPSIAELNIRDDEREDPVGDAAFSPVKGIVHRYPDRCLFMPVHVCLVYCRFCFRKEKVGSSEQSLTADEVEKAFKYIEENNVIWEVIITGGDPFILKPAQLKKFIDRLCRIEHVNVIRIHTRTPVVDPQRINDEMIAVLKCSKPVYIVLHANHYNELSADAVRACAILVDAGIPMLSQTVLLKGINDNAETLSQLMRCFIKNRIKPYYLHHGDLVKGSQHFRTTIAEGQQLMREMRGYLSGICQPTYIIDIPGGYGKVPIGHNYVTAVHSTASDSYYKLEDYQGSFHYYPYQSNN